MGLCPSSRNQSDVRSRFEQGTKPLYNVALKLELDPYGGTSTHGYRRHSQLRYALCTSEELLRKRRQIVVIH